MSTSEMGTASPQQEHAGAGAEGSSGTGWAKEEGLWWRTKLCYIQGFTPCTDMPFSTSSRTLKCISFLLPPPKRWLAKAA